MRHFSETGKQKVLDKRLEMEGVRKDGSVFPLEICISETEIAGRLLFTAAARDITERVIAEAALREQTADLEWGNEVLEKEAEIRKVAEKELQEARAKLESQVTERTGELAETNTELERTNAELQEQLSQRQMLEGQLVQAQKMESIGELAAGVAHEINNPVGFVMSNLGTLGEYVGTFKTLLGEYDGLAKAVLAEKVDEQKSAVERIEAIHIEEDLPYILEDVDSLLAESDEGVRRVKDIVQGLKSFARLDESEEKEADINEGIEATLKVIWNELKYKCQVHKKFGLIPRIRCNPGQLNQVFMNLLVNAAHAIEEQGDVTIETEATDSEILVRISDTGKGIAPEHLSKLFDPFFTTKPVGQGTGLGLSISYGIVQKHNGTIEVDSEVGKGSTFTIHLPLEGVSGEDASGGDSNG